MRKKSNYPLKLVLYNILMLIISIFSIAINSNASPFISKHSYSLDTIPDIKFETAQLRKSIQDLKRNMSTAKEEIANINWDHIKKDFDYDLANLEKDLLKQKIDITVAMKDINFKKMKDDIAKIDFEKVKGDINMDIEMQNMVDWDKIEKQLKEGLANIDFTKMEVNMQQLRNNLAAQKVQLQEQMKGGLKNLDQQMKKMESQLQGMKRGTEEMEKDGLIEKGKNYKIEFRKGVLYIDGMKQPDPVNEKYKQYFEKNFSTIGTEGGFDVEV